MNSLLSQTLILTSFAFSISAASVHIKPGGSGDGSGSDWNNARSSIPGDPIRGNTYYIAGGSYGSFYVGPVAGTNYVVFKKATVSEHGSNVGWVDSYGTSQAVFTWSIPSGVVWNLAGSYIQFSGVTGSGTSGYGFKFVTYKGAEAAVKINNGVGIAADGLILEYCELDGGGTGSGSATRLFYNAANYVNGRTIRNNYFHDSGAAFISESTGQDILIENNVFARVGSGNPAQHCVGIAFNSSQNITIRNNEFSDMLLNGSTTFLEPQGLSGNGVYVYGNRFKDTLGTSGCSQGIFAVTALDVCKNIYIYNNTVVGLRSALPGVWTGNVPGSTFVIRNNIWQGCVNIPSVGGLGAVIADNNIFNTGEVSFVNQSGGNFRLASQTSAGVGLPSTFSLDPDGVIRGTGGVWSKGAYQFVGVVLPQAPNAPSITSPTNGSTGISVTPTIQASAFSDPQSKTHSDTEWLLTQNLNTVFDVIAGSPTTSLNVGSGILGYATNYTVSVRYKNTPYNLWSSWSSPVTFYTINAPVAPPGTGTVTNGPTITTNINTFIFNGEITLKGSFRLINTNN